MSDSLITKKAIAQGLKELTVSKNFDKISIGDITSVCGLNRQTFYYHFQDKFELLNWIYYNEAFAFLIDGITFDNWHEKLCVLLLTMKKDQAFYGNTIKNEELCFKNYLLTITCTLFGDAIERLDVSGNVTAEDKRLYSEFFAYGICGVVISWVNSGMKETPFSVAKHLKQLAVNSELLAFERYVGV